MKRMRVDTLHPVARFRQNASFLANCRDDAAWYDVACATTHLVSGSLGQLACLADEAIAARQGYRGLSVQVRVALGVI